MRSVLLIEMRKSQRNAAKQKEARDRPTWVGEGESPVACLVVTTWLLVDIALRLELMLSAISMAVVLVY